MSTLIDDPEVLALVTKECLKQRSGELEVLYVTLKDQVLGDGATVAEHLAEADSEKSVAYFSRDIVFEDPLLAIGLYQPLSIADDRIAQAAQSIDRVYAFEGEPASNLIYYVGGDQLINESGEEGDEPVLYVSETDRVRLDQDAADNVISITKIAEFEGNAYYYAKYPAPMHIDDYIAKYGEPKSAPIVGRSPIRARLPAWYDIVQRVLYKDFKDDLFNSKMELRVRMIGKAAGVITHEFDLKRKQKNDWIFLDDQAPTIRWKEDLANGDEGHRVKYHFSDFDGGTGNSKWSVEYTAKIKPDDSSTEQTVTVKGEFGAGTDDEMGEGYEYFTNWVEPSTWGNQHKSGSNFEFWINIAED